MHTIKHISVFLFVDANNQIEFKDRLKSLLARHHQLRTNTH